MEREGEGKRRIEGKRGERGERVENGRNGEGRWRREEEEK